MLLLPILWQLITFGAGAQDTNTLEIIKQLQKRIEELEQKVKSLELDKQVDKQGKDAQAGQKIQDLDQKIKILEREREIEKETAETRARKRPKSPSEEKAFLWHLLTKVTTCN